MVGAGQQSSLVGKAGAVRVYPEMLNHACHLPRLPSWNRGRARGPLLPSIRQGGGQMGDGMMGTGREGRAVVSPLKPDSLGSNPSPAAD